MPVAVAWRPAVVGLITCAGYASALPETLESDEAAKLAQLWAEAPVLGMVPNAPSDTNDLGIVANNGTLTVRYTRQTMSGRGVAIYDSNGTFLEGDYGPPTLFPRERSASATGLADGTYYVATWGGFDDIVFNGFGVPEGREVARGRISSLGGNVQTISTEQIDGIRRWWSVV